MKRTLSKYDQQANRFLAQHSVNVDIKLAQHQTAPPWDDRGHGHGRKYDITITQVARDGQVEFPFWGSIKMREEGTHPTAYDILACISSDLYFESTEFNVAPLPKEALLEEGLDPKDYDLSYEQAKRAEDFSDELRSFFTEKEQEALGEIS